MKQLRVAIRKVEKGLEGNWIHQAPRQTGARHADARRPRTAGCEEHMTLSGVLFAGLGRDCQVSYRLRKSAFSALPMPFDYMSTPQQGLYELLATRFDRLMARNAWRVSDRTLVHRELPICICHLCAGGEIGATLALARIYLTTSLLRCCRRIPLPIVFVRLAETTGELAHSEELLGLVRKHAPTARLVHVIASDTASEWQEEASGLACATIRPGRTWRGDAFSWRRLLVRAHAWARAAHVPVPMSNVASLASVFLGADWQRVLLGVEQLQRSAGERRVDPPCPDP